MVPKPKPGERVGEGRGADLCILGTASSLPRVRASGYMLTDAFSLQS